MTDMEAERAFREMLPCEEAKVNIQTMKVRKLGTPSGIEIERHPSLVTKTFLIFPNGEKSIIRIEAKMLKLCDSKAV